MLVPCFFSSFFVTLSLNFILLYVWLLSFAIKILTEQVKDSVYAFMRVLLSIACEGRVVLA